MKKISTILRNLLEQYKTMPTAAKAGIWFLICNFIQKGIATLTTPVFTRLLSTSEYGRVNVFYSWADLLGIFITFGLSSAVYSRGLVKNEGDSNRYTSSMIGLALFTTVVSFSVVIIAKLTILNNYWLSILSILGVYAYVLFSTITEFWYQQKRVNYDYVPFVRLTLAVMLLKPLLSIIAIVVFPKDRVSARIIPDIAISGIVASILFIIMFRKSRNFYDYSTWKESMLFVIPLIPHYLSQRVLSQSDRLMISNMIGDSEAGVYSLAYSIGMLLILLNNAMDSTVAPWAYKKIKEKQFTKIAKLFEKLLIEYGLCTLCFSLFAPEIVQLFAPTAYHEAIFIIPIIALSSYYMFSYLQFVYFEYYSGKTQYVMIATLVCAVVNLILNLIFIRAYGYIAAAYTTLVCYILYAIGHYCIMKFLCKSFYHIPVPFQSIRIVQISIVTSVAIGVCLALYKTAVLRWVSGFFVIICTIGVSIKMMKSFKDIKS